MRKEKADPDSYDDTYCVSDSSTEDDETCNDEACEDAVEFKAMGHRKKNNGTFWTKQQAEALEALADFHSSARNWNEISETMKTRFPSLRLKSNHAIKTKYFALKRQNNSKDEHSSSSSDDDSDSDDVMPDIPTSEEQTMKEPQNSTNPHNIEKTASIPPADWLQEEEKHLLKIFQNFEKKSSNSSKRKFEETENDIFEKRRRIEDGTVLNPKMQLFKKRFVKLVFEKQKPKICQKLEENDDNEIEEEITINDLKKPPILAINQ